MTYSTQETGNGRPIDLYEFARAHLRWRYTSADRVVSHDGVDYQPAAIDRGRIEATRELARSRLTITIARDNPVADMYRVAPPSEVVTAIIRQVHVGDDESAVLWTGRVVGVEWQGVRAVLTMEPIYTSIRRLGLRRRYQRACPHVLYGSGCNISRDTWRLDSTATSISGLTVLAAGVNTQPDGYYAGGYIEWTAVDGVVERRHIASHVGPALDLTAAPVGLSTGQAIRVYPGCDHTLATCNSKFANTDNYGGMPYIPIRNPFGGLNPIY